MVEQQEGLHFLDYWRVVLARKEIVIAVLLLVVITGIVITYTMPRVYRSSVVIEVLEDKPDVAVFQPNVVRYDPLFLRTQFEVIQSSPIVEETVRRLNLTEKLGKAYGYLESLSDKAFDYTVGLVSRSMRVQQYRETNLIEIQVYLSEPKGEAPDLAADVANMISEVYRDVTARRSRQSIEKALKAVDDSLEEQDEKVDEAFQDVEDIRKKYELTVVRTSQGTESSLTRMTMTQLEMQRIRIKLEVAEKKARVDKIETLSEEAQLVGAIYVVGDASLAALVAQKRGAEINLDRLKEVGVGSKHPDMMQARAAVDGLDAKIQEALTGMKAGIQAEYEAAVAKLQALTDTLDEFKSEERQHEASGYREFDKAVADLEHAERIRDALEVRLVQERIEQRIPRTVVRVIEPAKAPGANSNVSPNPLMNIILSILAGLGSGVGLAFFIEYLDTSVKTLEDVERYMGVSVVGVIPQKVQPLIDESSASSHAEAYRVLRANLQFSKDAPEAKTYCVTSGSVGEGKSLTTFNLAYISAQAGERVLLVDGDLHRPTLHKILGASKSNGLSNVLVGEIDLDDAIVATKVPNLDFMSCGRLGSGSQRLLDNEKLKEVIGNLRERYDVVYFDSPPMIGVSDTSLLVREMDAVLLVIQHRKYPRVMSARAKLMIENVGATVAGVVLNNINVHREYYYYYHHYYYYYYPQYYGESDKRGGKRRRSRSKQVAAKIETDAAEDAS